MNIDFYNDIDYNLKLLKRFINKKKLNFVDIEAMISLTIDLLELFEILLDDSLNY